MWIIWMMIGAAIGAATMGALKNAQRGIFDVNKVMLMGRLTREPELRYTTNNNKAVCTYTLAVDRPGTYGDNKKSDFIKCIAWGKKAELAGKHFSKGRQVVVVGVWTTRTWDDNEGKKHYENECQVDEQYFADSKPAGASRGDAHEGGGGSGEQTDGFYPVDEDDELPF